AAHAAVGTCRSAHAPSSDRHPCARTPSETGWVPSSTTRWLDHRIWIGTGPRFVTWSRTWLPCTETTCALRARGAASSTRERFESCLCHPSARYGSPPLISAASSTDAKSSLASGTATYATASWSRHCRHDAAASGG